MTATKTPPAPKKPLSPKPATKKPATKKPATKKLAAANPAASKASVGKKPLAPKPAATKKMGPRADFGAPIDTFFAKQPASTRPIADALRELIEAAVPKATASLKWGMPVYELNGKMVCAIGGHKAHVNLLLSGPPGSFADPKGLLIGEGKTGKHLTLTAVAQLPRAQVRAWLKVAVALAS